MCKEKFLYPPPPLGVGCENEMVCRSQDFLFYPPPPLLPTISTPPPPRELLHCSARTTSTAPVFPQEKMLESDEEQLSKRRGQADKYQAIDPALTPIRKEIDRLQKRVADAHEALAYWREQRTVMASLRLTVANGCPELKRKRKRSQGPTADEEEPPAQRRSIFSGVGAWFGLGTR